VLQQPVDASLVNDQDRQFITQAGASNLTEIAEGKLAQSNSDNVAVQVFGQWMAANHVAAGATLNAIAKQLGVTSGGSPTAEQAQEIQSLRSQSGAPFDQLYAQGQVTDHQQTLALVQQEAANGQNPTLKSLAQQLIPILEQHLAGAQQLIAGSASENAGSGNTDGSGQTQTTTSQISTTGTTQTSTDTSSTSAAPTGTPSEQDTSFVQFAAQSGLAEVQEGQLALAQTSNLAVSEFGRWMVTDHTANNAVLQNLAQQEGIPVPAAPSADQQAEIARLQSLPPDAFASAYSEGQVTDHANALMQFIKEATTGQDPAIKAFAQETIPVLVQHLGGAINIELNQLGVNSLGSLSVGDLTQLLYGTGGTAINLAGSDSTTSGGPASQILGTMGLQDQSSTSMSMFGTALS